MANRVTIQDIADALGVSRNTVSKAINNTGILADATRDKILKKAVEMGYKQFSYTNIADYIKNEESQSPPKEDKEIALMTSKYLGDSHFSSTMLDKFQIEISRLGYSLSIHRILPDDIHGLRLPLTFNREKTDGIICYEMFDHAYSKMLCSLDIPTLFVDSPVVGLDEPLPTDRILMDNQTAIFEFVREMVSRNKKKIGFIGEYLHCQSFFERYMAYRNAMFLQGLPIPEEYCITGNREGVENPSANDYQEYLLENFKKLRELPDVFICANDFVAIDAIHVLKELGYEVPKDVYLCGFDDSQESRIITPPLTTIHIHSQILGFSAVHLLLSRIKEPSLNYRTLYAETDLVYRASTED